MQIFGSRSFGALQGLVQGGAIGAGMAGPVFYGWIFDSRESYNIAIYATIAITSRRCPSCTPPETEAGGKMVHRGGRTLISVRRMARNKTLNNLG